MISLAYSIYIDLRCSGAAIKCCVLDDSAATLQKVLQAPFEALSAREASATAMQLITGTLVTWTLLSLIRLGKCVTVAVLEFSQIAF